MANPDGGGVKRLRPEPPGSDNRGGDRRKLITRPCPFARRLVQLTVIQHAAQRPGAPNDWDTPIGAAPPVMVQATTQPDDFDTWSQIVWLGAQPLPWTPNRCLVSRAALGTFRVVAYLGGEAEHVDIHVHARLVRLDVRGATAQAPETWRAVYDPAQHVEVQAVTDPDTPAAWALIHWDGGAAVPGQANLRRVLRSELGEHTVTAALDIEDEATIEVEPELTALNIESGAALHQESGEWRALYDTNAPAVVRAVTNPDRQDAWARLRWDGGADRPGEPNRRSLTRARLGEVPVRVVLLDTHGAALGDRAGRIRVIPRLLRLEVVGAQAAAEGRYDLFFHQEDRATVRAYTEPDTPEAWALMRGEGGDPHPEANKRFVSLSRACDVPVAATLLGQGPVQTTVRVLPVRVTPRLNVPGEVLFFRPGGGAAGRITVSLLEEPSRGGVYRGGAKIGLSQANAALFLDEGCTVPVQLNNEGRGEIAEVRDGMPLFVRGTNAGDARLMLGLIEAPNVIIGRPDVQALRVRPVNEIRPVIRCDQLVLVHSNHHNRPTDPSRLILTIEQTIPEQACGDLQIELQYGAGIACFRDQACTNADAVASGTRFPAGAIPPMIYMRGLAAGNCDVRAGIRGTMGAGWHFADDATQTVLVERLDLAVARYAEGLSIPADAALAAPKQRELHARNAAIFTFARVTVTAPSAGFWQKADRLLLRHNNLGYFADAAGNHPGNDVLTQADFAAAVVRYAATRGAPAWDAFAPGDPLRNPAKVVNDEYFSCGARIQAACSADGNPKTLLYGDVVRLDTFSFDQHLDRLTGNECRNRIVAAAPGEPAGVALARAGAHRYYDLLSGFRVNRSHRLDGRSPYGSFLRSVRPAVGNLNARAASGADWVQAFLANPHGINLHAAMWTRIRDHIRHVLNGHPLPHADREHDGTLRSYGFARLYGPPGLHAECLAVNELLQLGLGLTPPNLTVATYMLQDQDRQGGRFVACPNCRGVLMAAPAVRVITG